MTSLFVSRFLLQGVGVRFAGEAQSVKRLLDYQEKSPLVDRCVCTHPSVVGQILIDCANQESERIVELFELQLKSTSNM